MREWQTFDTAPKDGTYMDVLCETEGGASVVVEKLRFSSVRGGALKLHGQNNDLSPYLTPTHWAPHDPALKAVA